MMGSLDQILVQALNGLTIGSILVLTTMGLTIIFGLMGIVNFAHGAFYAVGAYVGVSVLGYMSGSLGFVAAILVVPLVVGVIGATVETSVVRPLYDRDLIYSLLLTFGVMLVLHELIKIVWGKGGQTFGQPDFLDFMVSLNFVNYPAYRLFIIGMAAVVALSVWLFLHNTDLGMIVRAATQNRQMVKALGIDIGKVYTVVFAIGTGIAGLAGMLHAPLVSVYPEMGTPIIVQSFVVVVIGGLNSFRGSVVAGLIVGESIALTYLIWPPMTDVVIYLVMAGFLLVRPQGILGSETGVE